MQDRIALAIQAFKEAKSQGLTYYGACKLLNKQGFTQSEIEQASTQFTYTEIDPVATNSQSLNGNINKVFAEEIVHQEAVDNIKHQLKNDLGSNLLAGGRGGLFATGKTLSDVAALKEIEHSGPASGDPPKSTNSVNENIPQKGGSDTSSSPSTTVLSQVPSLRLFILYITIASTFQLLVLVVFHWALLASLIIIHFTVQGWLTTVIKIMLYAAQISVIVNFTLCLALTLSKSFTRTQQLISLTKLLIILSLIVNLLTGNIVNVGLGIFIYTYLNGVANDVYLVRTGEMKLT